MWIKAYSEEFVSAFFSYATSTFEVSNLFQFGLSQYCTEFIVSNPKLQYDSKNGLC